jgi:hypothetical protein
LNRPSASLLALFAGRQLGGERGAGDAEKRARAGYAHNKGKDRGRKILVSIRTQLIEKSRETEQIRASLLGFMRPGLVGFG